MPIRLPSLPSAPDAGNPTLIRSNAPMPSVPGSAAIDTGSLQRGARTLLAERPVDSGSVNAGVLALQDLSQAVRQAAGVPEDFSMKLMAAQNAADLARADTIMRDALQAQQTRMLELPEDKWEETWAKEGIPSAKEQIAKLNLSPAAMAELNPDLQRWELLSQSQIGNQAKRRKIENNIAAVNNAIDRAVMDDDLELAMTHIDNAQKTLLFSETDAEKARNGIRQKVISQAKERQANQIVAAIEADPDTILPELEKAARGESSDVIGEIDPIKASRFLNMATRESKAQRVELRNELHNAVLTGEITDPEELRKRAGDKLDAKVIANLEKVMGKEIAFNPETVSTLRTAIAKYDASADKDMAQYNRLMSEIESKIPQRLQGALASEINQTWNATVRQGKKREPKQDFTGSLFSEIDSMADRGMFGEYKSKGKDGTEIDEMKRLDAWNKAESIKDSMRDYLEKNPSATREDAINHFKGLLDPDIQQSAKDAIRKNLSGRLPGFWSQQGGSFADSLGATSPIQEPKAPATVRNNNPGAMWFVGGWQKDYGATFGETLNDGLGQGNQIARFPTPVAGAAAQFHLLSNYGNQTVEGAIRKWSGGNNVPSYLSKLKQAGFSPEDALPSILSDSSRAIEFVKAMAAHETGNDFPLSADQWQEAYSKFRTIKG